ncbi:ATP-binding protein, partial [Streptomyces sp. SID1328]|uniref:ATP-binding protein n=1 Tax=Streptomyces sp. SID1328 TaxID=2690250 RepID=UPI001F37D0E1
ALVDALRRGEPPPRGRPRRRPPEDADDFELLAADLARAHDGAVTAVVRAAQLSSQAANEQKLEVFVNLARRLQSLVHREISILDELENEIEDPDLLKGLFHVDHLATRIRRHAENLAVLGGAVSRRQWSNPVDMTEVLRSAIAEVEQYSRVKLVPPVEGELRGHAVADVIHLLAELVENATVFSAPQTQVLLRANLVTSGLAIEVEDRGLGLPVEEQHRMNALLADPDQVNVASLLADGRIGLYVVSQLARRHGISVRLQTNIYGGVQAVLVVPQGLLGASAGVVPGVEGAAAGPGQEAAGPGAEVAGAVGAAALSTPGAPATGRHRQVARRGMGSGDAAAPPPLPMRGAQEQRANPAEAVPGIGAGERAAVEANAGVLPTPRAGAAALATERPSLPRRRAQEHIVPQLRGGPVPRQDNDVVVGHDPGLMAAFQRGIGLAESQQSLEAAGEGFGEVPPGEGKPSETAYMEGTHTEPPHMGVEDMVVAHMGAGPLGAPHVEVAPVEAGHMEVGPMEVGPMEPPHMEPDHMALPSTEPDHMAPTPMAPDHTVSPPLEPNHLEPDPMPPGPLDRSAPPA